MNTNEYNERRGNDFYSVRKDPAHNKEAVIRNKSNGGAIQVTAGPFCDMILSGVSTL